jgi:hypothetical protein
VQIFDEAARRKSGFENRQRGGNENDIFISTERTDFAKFSFCLPGSGTIGF